MKKSIPIIATLCLAGCAATSSSVKQDPAAPPTAYMGPVCLLAAPLPPELKHQVLGEVEASKQWYGSLEEMLPPLAEEARKLGANAVVKVKVSQQIGLFAWARPVGSGTAVKAEGNTLDCVKLGGAMR